MASTKYPAGNNIFSVSEWTRCDQAAIDKFRVMNRRRVEAAINSTVHRDSYRIRAYIGRLIDGIGLLTEEDAWILGPHGGRNN